MKQKMKQSVLIAGLLALGLMGCQKQEEAPAPVVIEPEAPAPVVIEPAPIEPMPEAPPPGTESMQPAPGDMTTPPLEEPAPGDMPSTPPSQ